MMRHLLVLTGLFLVLGCQHRVTSAASPGGPLDGLAPEHRQAVVVSRKGCSSVSDVDVRLFERAGGEWRDAGRAAGVAGRSGIAPPGAKREGDGRTPSGVFPLERAFGYEPLDLRLPYLVLTPDMIWVDDARSPLYNRLATRAEGEGLSYETMRRDDHLYKYGLVVEYNTRPVVAGAGSAIFFHIWRAPSVPTSGCVALEEDDMLRVLRWLDPVQRPVTVIVPPAPCADEGPSPPPHS